MAGKVKLVAELTGDGKLREEGKEREQQAKQKPSEFNPFEDLNKLT